MSYAEPLTHHNQWAELLDVLDHAGFYGSAEEDVATLVEREVDRTRLHSVDGEQLRNSLHNRVVRAYRCAAAVLARSDDASDASRP